MQHVFFIAALLISTSAHAQPTIFYVAPSATDTAYASSQDKHLVILNKTVSYNNKLLVFLPGTGALTKHYTEFPKLAASLGYHCVSLAYPNDFPSITEACTGSADTDCFKNFRQEVCYGTPVSNAVSVDTLNSIATRLVKLLRYLNTTYPSDGWGAYLKQGNVNWNKIAVAGHSQGSGHALYFGKTKFCFRVIMFSGANDYSNLYKKPANWVSMPGLTPVSATYSFLHLKDDVVAYSKQYKVVQATGMTGSGDDSTSVDNAQPPYNHSHCLYTKAKPRFSFVYSSWHDGPVVDFYTPVNSKGNFLYTPVWKYMLTDSTTATALKSSTTVAGRITTAAE